MRIKQKIYMLATAALAFGFAACDNISEDDRYIELPALESQRVVLLEEFTGQNCRNCPEGHKAVADLTQQYPDNLVAVSIHGSELAYSETQLPGFGLANDESEAYYQVYKSTLPSGVVNRQGEPTVKDRWAAQVREELQKPAYVELKLTAQLSADGKQIEITADMLPSKNINGNLQLWITESHIKSLQNDNGTLIMDYEHNHVFRSSVNGFDGEKVNLVTREPKSVTRTCQLSDNWNPENITVVGFIYDQTGVQQAAKCKIK